MLFGYKKHITHDETIVMCLTFFIMFCAFRIFTRDNSTILFFERIKENLKLSSINQSRIANYLRFKLFFECADFEG